MKKDDLYIALLCALTHTPKTCEKCKKCDTKNKPARIHLIDELSKKFGKPSPWDNLDDLNKGDTK